MTLYQQTTYETCLSVCLLQATAAFVPVDLSQKLEIECLLHSLKFCKRDFVCGHIDYINKKFHLTVRRIVDSRPFYRYLQRGGCLPGTETEVRHMDVRLVDELVRLDTPILYIDAYYLLGGYHYPHFVMARAKRGRKFTVFDPWEGRYRVLKGRVLGSAISSLRKRLHFCPQVLLVEGTARNTQAEDAASRSVSVKGRAS